MHNLDMRSFSECVKEAISSSLNPLFGAVITSLTPSVRKFQYLRDFVNQYKETVIANNTI